MTDPDRGALLEVFKLREEHGPGRMYQSLPELFRDILEYVKEHPGCDVMSCDDAVRRHIGFYADTWENYWGFGLLALREFSNTLPDTTRLEVMEYLSTQTGRVKLASCLKEGRLPFSCPGLNLTT